MINIKGVIDGNTFIVGDINTLLTSINRLSRWKINKEIVALNDTLDQMYLIDIFRVFHPKLQNMHYFQVHMKLLAE